MGYDLEHFVGTVSEELICMICNKVLEQPLKVSKCKHHLCQRCIEGHSLCPVDGYELNSATLGPAPNMLKNMLFQLKTRCASASHGCGIVLPMENMQAQFQEALVMRKYGLGANEEYENELNAHLAALEAQLESVKQDFDKAIDKQVASAMCECRLCANVENATALNTRLDALEAELESVKQEFDKAIENQRASAMWDEEYATELDVRLEAIEADQEPVKQEFDKAIQSQVASPKCECRLCANKWNELDARLDALEAEVESTKQEFDKAVELIQKKSQQGLT